jgi:hypothetical protein
VTDTAMAEIDKVPNGQFSTELVVLGADVDPRELEVTATDNHSR